MLRTYNKLWVDTQHSIKVWIKRPLFTLIFIHDHSWFWFSFMITFDLDFHSWSLLRMITIDRNWSAGCDWHWASASSSLSPSSSSSSSSSPGCDWDWGSTAARKAGEGTEHSVQDGRQDLYQVIGIVWSRLWLFVCCDCVIVARIYIRWLGLCDCLLSIGIVWSLL